MFSKNQSIESERINGLKWLWLWGQPVRSANFSFFKSFLKVESVKQLIETKNQQVVFHLLWKTPFLLKNMIDFVLDQAKSRLINSNLPRPHVHKQQPSLQTNFTNLETSKLQVQQSPLIWWRLIPGLLGMFYLNLTIPAKQKICKYQR